MHRSTGHIFWKQDINDTVVQQKEQFMPQNILFQKSDPINN
jgi:hypothetical protein